MIVDDDLHVGILGAIPVQQRKEPAHGGLVFILKPVDLSGMNSLRRISAVQRRLRRSLHAQRDRAFGQ
jgi:hypothetical protein